MNFKKLFGLVLVVGLILCPLMGQDETKTKSEHPYYITLHSSSGSEEADFIVLITAEDAKFDIKKGRLVCKNGCWAYVKCVEDVTPVIAVLFKKIDILGWNKVVIQDLEAGRVVKYVKSSKTGKFVAWYR